MLKHSYVWKICFLFGLLTLILWSQGLMSFWWIFIPLGVYIALAAWGSSNVRSQFYLPVLFKGAATEKNIALTFDDGPSDENTLEVLEILKVYNIPAAFFCIGKKIELSPDIVKKIDQHGHLVGNHSYSHHNFINLFPTKKLIHDLDCANSIIKSVIGKTPLLFRPPYGVTNPIMALAMEKLNFKTIGWSLRTMDTKIKEDKVLFEKVIDRIKPGDIILFHEKCDQTVRILPKLIEHLRTEGYTFQRVDQLLNVKPYE